jgi:hypothetical protein
MFTTNDENEKTITLLKNDYGCQGSIKSRFNKTLLQGINPKKCHSERSKESRIFVELMVLVAQAFRPVLMSKIGLRKRSEKGDRVEIPVPFDQQIICHQRWLGL